MTRWALLVFFSLICLQASAQLCTGSLGDPIVHISFGSGSNPGAPLGTAAPGYGYVTTDCPGDGFYTVRNSTQACFGNSWHSVSRDHTGDANGYFMMVNASFSPGDFYVDTVRGLCSGTTYEFAAWVLNVLAGGSCGSAAVQPNITFRLEKTDGTLLSSYNTGTIGTSSSPQWQQFGLFFTTPPTVGTVVVRITNNAPGGCGNDLLLDDITFRACGPLLTPGFTGSTGTEKNLCFGQAATLQLNVALSAGYIFPRFQWQESISGGPWADIPGAVSQSYTLQVPANRAAGNYRYRLSVAESANWGTAACTVASSPLVVWVIGQPGIAVSNNGPACAGDTIVLNASGASTYQWTGPNNFTSSGSSAVLASVSIDEAGNYLVLATDSYGCSWPASTSVFVNQLPVAAVVADTVSFCSGDSAQLHASGGLVYNWIPAGGLSNANSPDPFASPADTTLYQAIVANAAGCADTATVLIRVRPTPKANAGPDRSMLLGDALTISGSVTGSNYTVKWSPDYFLSATSQLAVTARPERDTAYVLTATSLDGCGSSGDTVRIRVFRKVEVPNVFTPNGDGQNDRWEIPAMAAYRIYTIEVFGRNGQLVFSARNSFQPWSGEINGKPLPNGTYYYIIQIDDTAQRISGFVDLIR
jgi:gliding motility-associated-like protein